MRAHRNALVAIRSFWQLLLHNQVSFTSLSKALMRIEKSVNVVRPAPDDLVYCWRSNFSLKFVAWASEVAFRKEWAAGTLSRSTALAVRPSMQAEGIYKATLQRYPASPKLMRGYGKFLEAVKNNPWKAAKYFRCGCCNTRWSKLGASTSLPHV